MFRSPVDAEPFVTAGSRKVGDGGAEAVTVSSRVTPARNRNVLTIETITDCPQSISWNHPLLIPVFPLPLFPVSYIPFLLNKFFKKISFLVVRNMSRDTLWFFVNCYAPHSNFAR